MLKRPIELVPLAALSLLGVGLTHCGLRNDAAVEHERSSQSAASGSLRLALEVGDESLQTVTAEISGDDGFATQTHQIDVAGANGVVSIFLGALPVGSYQITLSAGRCSGSNGFDIRAAETSLADVHLACGEAEPATMGSVQVTGTLEADLPADCNHVSSIVAAPSIQRGVGPASNVQVVLRPGASASDIEWSTASGEGGGGALLGVSGAADQTVSFECQANGSVDIVARVTASSGAASCMQQARARIECID